MKMGTPYSIFLTQVKDGMQKEKELSEFTVRLNDKLLPIITKMLEKEKEKFK